ncbi:hypothetical protein pb186bvf_016831 [Paramecium bursaria]
MVCEKCEKKLPKTSQKEKAGMITNFSKPKFSPAGNHKCLKCKKRQVQMEDKYCQECAYKDGICKMCGIKILDTKFYRQSNT